MDHFSDSAFVTHSINVGPTCRVFDVAVCDFNLYGEGKFKVLVMLADSDDQKWWVDLFSPCLTASVREWG